ncbi:hypothetical protein SKAU_G00237460 [Synaphobranchus kaupii]|uniref:Uncharacterized protein n=1 Tax=Synaphobranchus kaupii TaxID=118154 RepID=A0A9Q1IT03_SYNKA|nr:hypothetical protein SKAU_G00237460 [Synaphobranchus kaupii]
MNGLILQDGNKRPSRWRPETHGGEHRASCFTEPRPSNAEPRFGNRKEGDNAAALWFAGKRRCLCGCASLAPGDPQGTVVALGSTFSLAVGASC